MSETALDLGTETPAAAPAVSTSTASASYALVGSYSTVQVLSPTLINNVVYCTIQTQPSGVIAARPVQESVFDKGQSGPELSNFANAIEQVMSDPRVIAGAGSQTIENSGLLADNVIFTVEYTDPVHAPNGATADAIVGVDRLDFSDATIGRTLLTGVMGIIDSVYANLKAAAGG